MLNLDLDDAFENFMRLVHGGKVKETSAQWNESRRVFFCGVEQMFSFAMQLTALPDDEAEQGLANIQKQLTDFAQRLMVERDLTAKEKCDNQIRLYAPCGCGSGKKFKFCCHQRTGAVAPAPQKYNKQPALKTNDGISDERFDALDEILRRKEGKLI